MNEQRNATVHAAAAGMSSIWQGAFRHWRRPRRWGQDGGFRLDSQGERPVPWISLNAFSAGPGTVRQPLTLTKN
jgi:hypothetical protein